MIRSRNDSERLLVVLKRHLKSHGWTGARLAKELSIGEATVKRWLGGKSVTIDRLSRLAGLCEMSLADLVREAERPASGLAQELTLAQERALMADEFLALMFVTILAGYPPEETATDFALPPRLIESALSRLERLALIDRLPGGRVRSLVDGTIIWNKAPMRTLFEQRMKAQFVMMDFSATESVYASEMVKLSPQGAATLAELIEEFRRKVQALARHDRDTTHRPASWFVSLAVMRPLDTSGLDRLRGG
ncbi:MAG: helix-turn-helix domain-containing protein [Sphingomonadaceae bacterium]